MNPKRWTDDEAPDLAEGWGIKSIEEADWALKRLGQLEAQAKSNRELFDREVGRLRLRLEAITAPLLDHQQFFQTALKSYAETNRDALIQGKRKSRDLLHGRIGFRQKGGGLEVVDKAALLAWAQGCPVEMGFVRVKEEPAVDQIKMAITLTGEVPPGCELKPVRDECYVEALLPQEAES